MTAEITWTHNLERVFGNLDAHGAHVRQRREVKAVNHIPDVFVWMDGRTKWWFLAKAEKLLRVTRDRKLWRDRIVHISKGRGI